MNMDDNIFVQHICTSHGRHRVLRCCCECVYCPILPAEGVFGHISTDHSKAVSLFDGSFDLMKAAKVAVS